MCACMCAGVHVKHVCIDIHSVLVRAGRCVRPQPAVPLITATPTTQLVAQSLLAALMHQARDRDRRQLSRHADLENPGMGLLVQEISASDASMVGFAMPY